MSITPERTRQARLFLLICAFVSSIYLLTYRATIQTGDTRRAMDAVTSFVRYGDWLMDESSWTKPPLRIRDYAALPLANYDVEERLNIVLAAPLLRLAELIPRLGNIHALWLFNIFITAVGVGFLYLNIRQLGFHDAAAVLVALTAGLATNLFAYSQTFFREPLAMLFVLLAWYVIQIGRGRKKSSQLLNILLAIVCMSLATMTKYSALMALPGLLAFWLPGRATLSRRARIRLATTVMAVMAAVLLFTMLSEALPQRLREEFVRLGVQSEFSARALRVYLLSPAASIWATSPILTLSVAGSAIFWRRGRLRLVVSIWMIAIGYALGHALLTGPHWFGGLSYPPRFLLPVVPLLALATAPIAEILLNQGQRLARSIWIALLLYGVWIQFSAVSLDFWHYSDSLPAGAQRNAEWSPALLQPQYFRWVVLPQRWADLGLGFVWTRSMIPTWGISFAAYAAILAACIWFMLRNPASRWRHAVPPIVFLCLPLTLLNLSLVYDKDPRTQSGERALHNLLDFLAQHAEPDDILLLPGNDYGDFILNHLDRNMPRPIIIERPQAQAASDRQPATVVSHNPNDWFDVQSARIIRHLTAQHDRVWLLTNTSSYMTWSFQPLERYMARHFYPLREIKLDNAEAAARLYEVSTIRPAPNPFSPYSADIASDIRFGGHIRLSGLSFPGGTQYQAGDAVELSLLWQTDQALDRDYTVAWFIADAETQLPIAQGHDTGPQFGYAPTSSWLPGQEVWDNRALRLPSDAAPGSYQVWLLMYSFTETGAIERLPVSGAEVIAEGAVAVLPLSLTVGPNA